jgi:GNAT superfamily N-acetyltransferase
MQHRHDQLLSHHIVTLNETRIDKRTINSPIVRPPHGQSSIRELRTAGAQACNVFVEHLNRHDTRRRFASSWTYSFHHFLPGFARAHEGMAFAAVDATEMILGVVTLAYLNCHSTEIAVIVRSDCERCGIGRSLLAHVVQRAGDDGLSELVGYVLVENQAMLALARVMGFQSSRWDSLFFEVRQLVSAKEV